MGTVTTNFSLYKPASGETGWTSAVNVNWDTIDANLTNALPRGYLAGCQLTNNAGSPLTRVDISAGQAQDNNNAGAMTLTAITKDISAAWAVGTNSGGLATSLTLLANTWYHVFVIKRTDTNVVDVYFDSSVTAANIPTSYTLYRRVGSVKTDAGSLLLTFAQNGDDFSWLTPVRDFDDATPGTAAVLRTLNVPLGVKVKAIFNAIVTGGTGACYFSDPALTDTTPPIGGGTTAPGAQIGSNTGVASATVWGSVAMYTDTSSRLRTRCATNERLSLTTTGWVDTRGRDN